MADEAVQAQMQDMDARERSVADHSADVNLAAAAAGGWLARQQRLHNSAGAAGKPQLQFSARVVDTGVLMRLAWCTAALHHQGSGAAVSILAHLLIYLPAGDLTHVLGSDYRLARLGCPLSLSCAWEALLHTQTLRLGCHFEGCCHQD